MNPAMHISRSDVEKFSAAGVAYESLPLPRNYFPRLRLSAHDLDEYAELARELLDASLARLGDAKARATQRREWKELGASGGFRRFAQRVAGGDQRFRVEGASRAPLHSLMGALVADTTAQAKARRAHLFRDLLDAQTLAVLQPRAEALEAAGADEFLALRWQAVSLGASATAQHWDMCVLEYTGVTADAEGLPVGFHLTTSVERPECGLLQESYGLSRLRGTEVLLLLPAKGGGHTDVVLDGVWREPEMVSTWVVQGFLAVASSSLSKLAQLVQDQVLARLPVLPKGALVPPGDRKTCNVCLAKFGLMSKKSNCRSCGEVVCKACVVAPSSSSASASASSSSSTANAKFCKKCLVEASSQRSVMDASSLSGHSFDRDRRSSSSTASLSRYTAGSGATATPSRRFGSEAAGSGTPNPASSGSGAGAAAASMLVPAGYSTPRVQRMGSSNRLLGSADAGKAAYADYGYSLASTASVSSYDSFSESVPDRAGSEFYDVDEDGVLVVSAKSAARALGGGPPASRAVVSKAGGVPTVQAVEDSIAHQRFLLHEMMTQARSYHQQQQARTYHQHHQA